MTSGRSSAVKTKLDALATKWPPPKAVELVENEDFSEVLQDVLQNLSFGGRPKKVYMLTPEAFKTVA
jgi:hypothetical protein